MNNLSINPEQSLEQPVVSLPPKINPLYILGGLFIMALILTGGIFIGKYLNTSKNIPVKETIPTPTLYPSPTTTPTLNPIANWKTYRSDIHKFTFKYPQNWLGPEEFNDYYISVGTSKPHTYGKNIEFDFPVNDSYFVTILSNYRRTMPISTWESQAWMVDIKESVNLTVGKSTISHGVRKTKIRNRTISDLSASEILLDNDPQGGGTEFTYTDEIVIKTLDFVIRIEASPVIVSVKDKLERQNKAKEISNQYEETFNQILSTFKLLDNNQASLQPADSQSPAAGVCSGVSQDQVITVTMSMDNVPSPRCAKVVAKQMLKIVNDSTSAININLTQFKTTILPGKSYEFPNNLGSFLAPGVHTIAGSEIWLQNPS